MKLVNDILIGGILDFLPTMYTRKWLIVHQKIQKCIINRLGRIEKEFNTRLVCQLNLPLSSYLCIQAVIRLRKPHLPGEPPQWIWIKILPYFR